MKVTTLIVLGGLLFAGTSLAAEPQQAATTDGSSKVGIDAKTGKLRRLSAAESAQLDAITAKQKAATAKAKGNSAAKGKSVAKAGPIAFVAANGMTVVELDETHMTEVQATMGSDGKVVVSHDGQPLQGAVEAANE